MATRERPIPREFRNCGAGECSIKCRNMGSGCIADSQNPMNCDCWCFRSLQIRSKRPKMVNGRKIAEEQKTQFKTFKPRIKVTSQTKVSICTRDLPIRGLAQLLDKYLPNKIVVPANRATDKVTLRLKNKTFSQIIDRSGLTLKD